MHCLDIGASRQSRPALPMTVFFCMESLRPCAPSVPYGAAQHFGSHAPQALRRAMEGGKNDYSGHRHGPRVVHPDHGRLHGYRKAPELIVWFIKEQASCYFIIASRTPSSCPLISLRSQVVPGCQAGVMNMQPYKPLHGS